MTRSRRFFKLLAGHCHRGRDGALRRPRRVQWRNMRSDSHVIKHLFSPLNADWDGAARHPYQMVTVFTCHPSSVGSSTLAD
jgi:hypothetical protein